MVRTSNWLKWNQLRQIQYIIIVLRIANFKENQEMKSTLYLSQDNTVRQSGQWDFQKWIGWVSIKKKSGWRISTGTYLEGRPCWHLTVGTMSRQIHNCFPHCKYFSKQCQCKTIRHWCLWKVTPRSNTKGTTRKGTSI